MVVSVVVAVALVGASIANAASAKAKLNVTTIAQKQILKKDGLQVKVIGLKKGKLKLKAKSSTFDQQQHKKLADAAKAVANDGKAVKVILPLTAKGEDAISSCENRKIYVERQGSGPGALRADPQHQGLQAGAGRHLRRRQLRLHRHAGQLAVPAPVPRRLLHGHRQVHRHRQAPEPHRRRDAAEQGRGADGLGAV